MPGAGAGVEKFWKNISVMSNRLCVLAVVGLGLVEEVGVEVAPVVLSAGPCVLPAAPGLIRSKRDPVEVLPDSVVVSLSPVESCLSVTPMLRL